MKRESQIERKKVLIKTASLILTAGLIVFSYFYISDLLSEVNIRNLTINPIFLILSFVLFGGFYIVFSHHWLLAVRQVNPKAPNAQKLAFVASQPYKYLPTSAFTFSLRAVYAKKLGLSFKDSTLAQLLENFSLIGVSLALFGILFAFRLNAMYGILVLLVCLGVEGVLFLGNKTFIANIGSHTATVRTRGLSIMFLVAALGWAITDVSLAMLNYSLGFGFDGVVSLMAANNLAFAASILAFFAPGGIGVREVIFETFMVLPVTILCWRIMTFMFDMVFGIGAILLIRIRKKV